MIEVSGAASLPAELSSFVGRDEELREIERLLTTSRLVTLSGVGGVGKTRLALRAAAMVRRAYRDGVRLVTLAELDNERLLPEAFAAALGLVDQSGRDQMQVLREFLADRELLLIVDNCEHMVGACARIVSDVLQAAQGLRIVTTSREILRVTGEQVFPVTPLAAPPAGHVDDLDHVRRFPALALLIERATAAQRGFKATPENLGDLIKVCQRLDGIPLAIELAAARVRSLSIAQLAVGIDDRFVLLTRGSTVAPRRHQTLRTAIDWSFTLSEPAEQSVWVRTSVLVGKFDSDAVNAVCGDDLPPETIMDALAGLVDKSILTAEDEAGRQQYRMLDTLRQYGLDQLRHPNGKQQWGVDEVALRQRLLAYCLTLAQQFNDDWFGPRQRSWVRWLTAALPTIRHCIDECLNTGQERAALRLVGLLNCFWYGGTVAREGRVWLERVLAADTQPSAERAQALTVYGLLLASGGMPEAAAGPVTECLEIAQKIDDPAVLTDALAGRALNLIQLRPMGTPTSGTLRRPPAERRNGVSAVSAPWLTEAISMLDESLRRAARENRPFGLAVATHFRGLAALAANDLRTADEQLASCREYSRAQGDQWWLSRVLANSAPVALLMQDPERASAYGREALQVNVAIDDLMGLTISLEVLAWAAAAQGEHQRAAALLGASARQARANGGNPYDTGMFLPLRQRCITAIRQALGEDAYHHTFEAGFALSLHEAVACALGDDGVALRQPPIADSPTAVLTPRERDVAQLISEGLTNKQIAARLNIALRTAESHIEHILAKLQFTSRTQLAVWYAAQI